MKLFVILPRFPYPLDKGDKLRAYHQIKDLSKQHEIYLFCLNESNVEKADLEHIQSFCKEVHIHYVSSVMQKIKAFFSLFSYKPIQVAMFYSSSFKRLIHRKINELKPGHLYCQLIRTSEYIKDIHGIKKTIDYMDALSTGMMRISGENGFPMNRIYKIESKRLLSYENLIYDYFDHHTIISEQDQDLIYHEKRKHIKVIRNGVDIENLTAIDIPKKYDLVFHGNMNYPPNVTSAIYIVEEILPACRQLGFTPSVLISGANPHPKLQELASDKVHIAGWVDDIRESYCSARIFVAPMLINTGLQNKILESMSLRVPCISSRMANNAIKAIDGKHLLIASKPEEFAKKIQHLLENEHQAKRLAEEARKFVEENYTWEANNAKLNALISSK